VKHVLRNVNNTPIWTTVKGVHRYVEDVLWNVAKCNSQELINYNLRGLRSIGKMDGDVFTWIVPSNSNPCRWYKVMFLGFDDSR
jgi:hypothetical protein